MNIRKLKYQLIINILIILLFGCDSSVNNENITINFQNNSKHYSYYHAGDPGNDVVIVKTDFNAVVHKNDIQLIDTSYNYSSFFFKNMDVDYWQNLYNFGSDTNINIVERTSDSVFVNYLNTLYVFNFIDFDVTIDTFNNTPYPNIVEPITATTQDSNSIDSLNAAYNWYLTYSLWKEAITSAY